MSDKRELIKMARAGEEQPAVRTTIVGGRPPGSGQGVGDIPRGMEILVKKAAIDNAFREYLLTERAAAADRIGLKLEAAEAAMLAAIPAKQLEGVIAGTRVSPHLHNAFMGYTAAVMLAALGATAARAADDGPRFTGINPDMPMAGVMAETIEGYTVYYDPAVAEDSAFITGHVWDPQGQPRAGAVVAVEGTMLGTETNAEGYYSLGPLAPGTFVITCELSGYEPARAAAVPAKGHSSTALDFTLAWAPEPCGGARPDDPEGAEP